MSSKGVGDSGDSPSVGGSHSPGEGDENSENVDKVEGVAEKKLAKTARTKGEPQQLEGRVSPGGESIWSKICRFFSGKLGVNSPKGLEFRKELNMASENRQAELSDPDKQSFRTAFEYARDKGLANYGYEMRGHTFTKKKGLKAEVARHMLKKGRATKERIALCLGCTSQSIEHGMYNKLVDKVKEYKGLYVQQGYKDYKKNKAKADSLKKEIEECAKAPARLARFRSTSGGEDVSEDDLGRINPKA